MRKEMHLKNPDDVATEPQHKSHVYKKQQLTKR
jgi:hypothetical protein